MCSIKLMKFLLNCGWKQRMIFAVAKDRSEKFSERDSTPDLGDAGALQSHQFSYQANGELVIIWVNDKPVDSGYMRSN